MNESHDDAFLLLLIPKSMHLSNYLVLSLYIVVTIVVRPVLVQPTPLIVSIVYKRTWGQRQGGDSGGWVHR